MTTSADESKARREEGRAREKQGMTGVQRVYRALVGHRPPASELRTPQAAATAARTLHKELKKLMTRERLTPEPGDWVVSVAFISADLTVLGLTPMFVPGDEAALTAGNGAVLAPGNEAALIEALKNNIALGLVFGVKDREDEDKEKRVVVGARPFLTTKQTEDWFKELFPVLRMYVED